MEKLSIPVVLGTARTDRASERVAQFVFNTISNNKEIEAVFVDVKDHAPAYTTPPWGKGGADEKPTKWKEIAEKADAFVLVIPEYNRGYPGELKLLLDSLHNEYSKKPVLVCGVSTGMFGGRALALHIMPVLAELKMVPMRGSLFFGNVKEMFNEQGQVVDKGHIERVGKQVSELLWFGKVLKENRP